MEFLFHFIFGLIKIAILGCVGATLFLLIFLIIGHYNKDSWIDRVSKKRLKFWFLTGLFISIGLLMFTLSYWGNHGFGDNAKVPIGHFKTVELINNDIYIENIKGDQLGILKFTFDKDKLYAETQDNSETGKGDYVIWDLRTDEWKYYKDQTEYIKIAKVNNYPLPDQFEDFGVFYDRHWGGIRFWILP